MPNNRRIVRTNYGLITGQNIMQPLKIFIKHLQYKENTFVTLVKKQN